MDFADLQEAGTFICGHPKSGTSLLMTLLDSHPQLIVYPEETSYFTQFQPETSHLELQDRLLAAEEKLLHIFHWDPDKPHPTQANYPDRDYRNISFEEVRRLYHQYLNLWDPQSERILPAIILAYGQAREDISHGIRRWVEKTPFNEHFAEKIFQYWSQAKCVQILRDPRDNFASYHRKQPEWSPEYFASSWADSLSRGEKNLQQYGEDRYLILRYEDLVTDLEGSLQILREFIGIDDDPTLRQPTRNGSPWGGNSMFGEQFNGVSDNPIGRYNENLRPQVVSRLEAALHRQMASWDYALEHRISPSAWALWQGYRFKRAALDLIRSEPSS
jgi:hypothetical protein